MACRHPLNQRTGTELGHLAPCPALRTGRSAPRGRVPTATEKLVEGRKRPPPPATAPCSLHPLCQGTPSGGRWLVLFDFLGGTSRRPTPWLRICARKAGSQHRGEAVRCAWQGCEVCQQVRREVPHDLHALPKLWCCGRHSAGPTPRLGLIQEWTRCANGRGGRDAQTPSLPCLRDCGDSIWTDRHSSSSLIDMRNNCLLC